jgi:hypothetical protein
MLSTTKAATERQRDASDIVTLERLKAMGRG